MTTSNTETTADIFAVEGGLMVRVEGMNEPAYYVDGDIDTVLDKEGDFWQRSDETGNFYMPLDPWNETEEQATTPLAEIDEDYGIADFNVPVPTEEPEPEPDAPGPRYKRGDVTYNRITGREALVLDSSALAGVGYLYTVVERGYRYPAGCSTTPGAGTMPESVLDPTGQPPFSEFEVRILTIVYGAAL